MATDLYFTPSGDFSVSVKGDLAVTTGDVQQIEQQALLRLATQKGDFVTYQSLGASLQRLVGMPNSQETADFGKKLIANAIQRDKNLGTVKVDAWPTSPSTMRFEVQIEYGKETSVILTIDQLLTI
jgi:hypothetical protein